MRLHFFFDLNSKISIFLLAYSCLCLAPLIAQLLGQMILQYCSYWSKGLGLDNCQPTVQYWWMVESCSLRKTQASAKYLVFTHFTLHIHSNSINVTLVMLAGTESLGALLLLLLCLKRLSSLLIIVCCSAACLDLSTTTVCLLNIKLKFYNDDILMIWYVYYLLCMIINSIYLIQLYIFNI